MNNKECSVVRDVLPLYIDEILLDDTKKFVEEHLENCSNCRKELHVLQEDLINTQAIDTAIPLKKFKKTIKKNIMLTVLLSVVVVIAVSVSIFAINATMQISLYQEEKAQHNLTNWHNLYLMSRTVKHSVTSTEDIDEAISWHVNTTVYRAIDGISPDFNYGYYMFFGIEYDMLLKALLYDELSEDEKQEAFSLFIDMNNQLYDLTVFVIELSDEELLELIDENSETYKNLALRIEEFCLEYHEKISDYI